MFCPVCGQQQISQDTRFCSRCGFLLTGIEQVITNEGSLPFIVLPKDPKAATPRKLGLKKGLMIFLLTFLVVPIITLISIALHIGPFFVAISAILLGVGGLLRMAYALLMESNEPNEMTLEENALASAKNLMGRYSNQNALPPQQSIPTNFYAPPVGNWRETNDLVQPSVTDETTKFLDRK